MLKGLVCLVLGLMIHSDPVFAVDRMEILQGAEHGNMNDAYFLGVMYRTGAGVAPDCGEALKWTRQAALHGHALAQSHLGMLYREGCEPNVTKEPSTAYFWTTLAAKQGLQVAERNLAELEGLLHPYLIAEARNKAENFKPIEGN